MRVASVGRAFEPPTGESHSRLRGWATPPGGHPQTRSTSLALLAALALHAVLLAVAAGFVFSVVESRQVVPITLLPGGGGQGGVAPAAPAPAPPAVEARPRAAAPVRAESSRRRAARPQAAVAAAPGPPAAVEAPSGANTGGSTAAAAGAGSGSGGGAGGGSGAGTGPGRGNGGSGGVDLRLYCLACPEPVYPRLARARGWQGATDVELTVLADGRVDEVAVARSSGFEVLDRAALEVARQSRFSPPAESLSPPIRGRLAYRFELRAR